MSLIDGDVILIPPCRRTPKQVYFLRDSFHAASSPFPPPPNRPHAMILELAMLSGSPVPSFSPLMRIQNLDCNTLRTRFVGGATESLQPIFTPLCIPVIYCPYIQEFSSKKKKKKKTFIVVHTFTHCSFVSQGVFPFCLVYTPLPSTHTYDSNIKTCAAWRHARFTSPNLQPPSASILPKTSRWMPSRSSHLATALCRLPQPQLIRSIH